MLDQYLYVDDMIYGASTVAEAMKLTTTTVSTFTDENMKLKKFVTNASELKVAWNGNPVIEINVNCSNLKVLKLNWNNEEDVLAIDLTYLVSIGNSLEFTKRYDLQTASKVFETIGFLSPLIIRAKILLQELWQFGL